MAQTGRNEPCPCGSGKKYKKCCLEQEQSVAPFSAASVSAELQQAMAEHEFNSLEEANAFANSFMEHRNLKPFDDFHGLSPEQMHYVLNRPFYSPQLVTFPEKLESMPDAPILSLLTLLVEAIGDKGLKPTAKGNLPRNSARRRLLPTGRRKPINVTQDMATSTKKRTFLNCMLLVLWLKWPVWSVSIRAISSSAVSVATSSLAMVCRRSIPDC